MSEVEPDPRRHAGDDLGERRKRSSGSSHAADLAGYEASVRVILGQIMAVSTLPAHYVGVFTDNPAIRRCTAGRGGHR